jgi:hypothetical protein
VSFLLALAVLASPARAWAKPRLIYRYAPSPAVVDQPTIFHAGRLACRARLHCRYLWQQDVRKGHRRHERRLGRGKRLSVTFRSAGTKRIRLKVYRRRRLRAQVVRRITVVRVRLSDDPTTGSGPPPGSGGTPPGATEPPLPSDPDPMPPPAPGPPVMVDPPPCDLDATPSTLSAQLAASTAGQTLCLSSGDYGVWRGTGRSVVVRAADGASVSMGFEFGAGDRGFTLEGVSIRGGRVTAGAGPFTVRDSAFSDGLFVDGVANSGILVDHVSFVGINSCSGCDPAMVHLAYDSTTPSGVTIANSLFADGNADGIQTGVGVNIIGNEFRNLYEGSCSSCHTDPIQLIDAPGAVVRGNWVHDTADGIVAYDGLRNATIEDNVVELVHGRWGIELYSDQGSVVRHNTLVYGTGCEYAPCGWIMLDRKDQDPAGSGTVIEDNIATAITSDDGSTAAEQDHNLVRRQVGSGDSLGTPTFVGGADPTTWAGFQLAPGSAGTGFASDGLNAGIRSSY